MQRALYFPYIRVPKNDWFTRVLLYWDGVDAIVPTDYWDRPEALGPFMTALMREGLVSAIAPAMFVHSIPRFGQDFLNLVSPRARGRPEQRPSVWGRWPRIHMEKLGQLTDHLCGMGLAVRSDARGYVSWYHVEPQTARDFMLYLAITIGQSRDDLAPMTDSNSRLQTLVPRGNSLEESHLRSVVLNGVLPSPSGEVGAADLQRFKQRNSNLLRTFRRRIEDIVSQLMAISDNSARDERMDHVIKDLRAEAREVTELLRTARCWPRISVGTICSLGASMILLPEAMAGGKAMVAAGTLTVIGAAASALREAKPDLSNQPMAYAALASRIH